MGITTFSAPSTTAVRRYRQAGQIESLGDIDDRSLHSLPNGYFSSTPDNTFGQPSRRRKGNLPGSPPGQPTENPMTPMDVISGIQLGGKAINNLLNPVEEIEVSEYGETSLGDSGLSIIQPSGEMPNNILELVLSFLKGDALSIEAEMVTVAYSEDGCQVGICVDGRVSIYGLENFCVLKRKEGCIDPSEPSPQPQRPGRPAGWEPYPLPMPPGTSIPITTPGLFLDMQHLGSKGYNQSVSWDNYRPGYPWAFLSVGDVISCEALSSPTGTGDCGGANNAINFYLRDKRGYTRYKATLYMFSSGNTFVAGKCVPSIFCDSANFSFQLTDWDGNNYNPYPLTAPEPPNKEPPEPPPPAPRNNQKNRKDKKMCCKNEKDNSLLLKRIAKATYGGARKDVFGGKLTQLVGKQNQVTFNSIPEMMAHMYVQFDSVLGHFPLRIKVKDGDLSTEGDQGTSSGSDQDSSANEIEFPNLAELLGDIWTQGYVSAMSEDATLDIVQRIPGEIERGKHTAIKTSREVLAISQFLGFEKNYEMGEIPSSFNYDLKDGDPIHKFLEPSKMKTRLAVAAHKGNLADAIDHIYHASSMIKALFSGDSSDVEKIGKQALESVKKPAEDDPDETEFKRFVNYINREGGINRGTNTSKPDIDLYKIQENASIDVIPTETSNSD